MLVVLFEYLRVFTQRMYFTKFLFSVFVKSFKILLFVEAILNTYVVSELIKGEMCLYFEISDFSLRIGWVLLRTSRDAGLVNFEASCNPNFDMKKIRINLVINRLLIRLIKTGIDSIKSLSEKNTRLMLCI